MHLLVGVRASAFIRRVTIFHWIMVGHRFFVAKQFSQVSKR